MELEALMRRQAIKVITQTEVKRIIYTDDEAESVVLGNGSTLSFNYLICNADPPVVYEKLLGKRSNYSMGLKKWLPDRFVNYSTGTLCIILWNKKTISRHCPSHHLAYGAF